MISNFDEFNSKEIEEASLDNNTLNLVFVKKILFIKKKTTLSIQANEDISSIRVDLLKKGTFINGQLKDKLTLTLKDNTQFQYKVTFKVKDIIRK